MGVCAFGGDLRPLRRKSRSPAKLFCYSVVQCPVDLQTELAWSGVHEPCQRLQASGGCPRPPPNADIFQSIQSVSMVVRCAPCSAVKQCQHDWRRSWCSAASCWSTDERLACQTKLKSGVFRDARARLERTELLSGSGRKRSRSRRARIRPGACMR
jgi:hypothetical protein